jgi:hypothetical protein
MSSPGLGCGRLLRWVGALVFGGQEPSIHSLAVTCTFQTLGYGPQCFKDTNLDSPPSAEGRFTAVWRRFGYLTAEMSRILSAILKANLVSGFSSDTSSSSSIFSILLTTVFR